MMKMSGRSIFSLVIVIFMIILVINSFEYNSKARLIPLGVGFLVLVMTFLQFLTDTIPSMGRRFSFLREKGMFTQQVNDQPNSESESQESEVRWSQIIKTFIWLIGFTVLLHFTTYLFAVPIFLFLFIWLAGKEKIISALSVAFGMGVSMYVLFELLLGARF